MSTDAESPPVGVSENIFEIGMSVKKLFRKNLIKFSLLGVDGRYS